MNQKLFLLQFKRLLITFGIITASLYLGSFILEAVIQHTRENPPELRNLLNGIVLVICFCLGPVYGAATFPRDFRETQFLFLQTLPMRRARMWAVLVLAGLLAALLATGIITALVSFSTSTPGFLAKMALRDFLIAGAAYIMGFAAGACFSLVFRRDLAVLLLSLATPSAIAAELVLLGMFLTSFPGFRGVSEPDNLFLAGGFVISAVLLLGLSLRFFTGGEFCLFRVQLRQLASLGTGLLALVLLATLSVHFGASGWLRGYDVWAYPEGSLRSVDVSPDGRYMAVLERRDRQPQFTRINIVDMGTGRLIAVRPARGAASLYWSSATVLNVRRSEDSPLLRLNYLLDGKDEIVRLDPRAKVLTRTRLPAGRLAAAEVIGGNLLMVTRSGEKGTVFRLDASAGAIQELCSAELMGQARIIPAGNEAVVVFGTREGTAPAWRIGTSAQPMNIQLPAPALDSLRCVVDGAAFHAPDLCEARLAERYPLAAPESPSARRGMFLNPFFVDRSSRLFFLEAQANETARLFGWNPESRQWTLRLRDIALSPAEAAALLAGQGTSGLTSVLFAARSFAASVDRGAFAYSVREPQGYHLYVYDDTAGRTADLGMLAQQPTPPKAVVRRFAASDALLVAFWADPGQAGSSAREGLPATLAFRYVPGAGTRQPLENLSENPRSIIAVGEDGSYTLIHWRTKQAPQRLLRRKGGQEQQLWPPAL